jgi:2-polyprenyl-3-methyl-5-hydroxy-6-metoxy-1,4-benzoquinol methylase
MADFYEQRSGKTVSDPATAALIDLAGDVAGLRLLEVACGQGRVARELARRGATLTGLDISDELLARARAYEAADPQGISYLHADVTAPDVLRGQVFDGLVCNYGLSDIDDLDGLMANVARWLRPGGAFVFSLLHPCFPGWDRDAPSSWPPRRRRLVAFLAGTGPPHLGWPGSRSPPGEEPAIHPRNSRQVHYRAGSSSQSRRPGWQRR